MFSKNLETRASEYLNTRDATRVRAQQETTPWHNLSELRFPYSP